MTELSHTIKELFYNPNTDSISSLVHDIEEAHKQILKNTDVSKGTLAPGQKDHEAAIEGFNIPNEGVSKESIPTLISGLFNGVPRWHSPHTMYNVAPPPVLPTVVSKTFTSLYNPNLVLATASGESTVTEQKVIKAIADYIGWDRASASGIFTFGGKATTIYGLKLGLKKCSPTASTQGVKEDIVVLSTVAGHPSHISDAEWLGIGTENVIRLKTDENGRINLADMEQTIREQTGNGKKVAAIILSGGTTNNMVVDPIAKVVEIRDKLVHELDLGYEPHVHVDAVVGFPWIFFKNYDFALNPLHIEPAAANKITEIVNDLRGLDCADSFGIDFHKMGFCPYVSSLFMVKDGTAFNGLKDVRNSPFVYSIENSRAGDGPNSAYVALNVLGETGFQALIAHLTETAIDLQKKIEDSGHFEVINKTGLGSSVMFSPLLPKGVTFANSTDEVAIRNVYSTRFIEKLSELGNTYYLDKVPGNATGANPYPYVALKAYIMSPYSCAESNEKFIAFMVSLKDEIDQEFNFTNADILPEADFAHPLK